MGATLTLAHAPQHNINTTSTTTIASRAHKCARFGDGGEVTPPDGPKPPPDGDSSTRQSTSVFWFSAK